MALAIPASAQVPNLPPMCDEAVASVVDLWPPNHKMVEVTVDDVFDPDGDPVLLIVTSVFQDEPADDTGDGATCPDAVLGPDSVSVRAERSGSGDGRVYHIAFMADDGRGGLCTGGVQVCVRHDRRPGGTCGDQGAIFDATATCGEPVCGVAACVPPFADLLAICEVPLPTFVQRRVARASRLLARAEIAPGAHARRLGRRAAKHLRRVADAAGRLGGDTCGAPVLAAAACAECLDPLD